MVLDPDADGPGILTERDVLDAVAHDQDLDVEVAADHLTPDAVVATPDWPLEQAAAAMLAGGFRQFFLNIAIVFGAIILVLNLVKTISLRTRRH